MTLEQEITVAEGKKMELNLNGHDIVFDSEELYTAYLDRCNHGDEYDNKALVNDYIRLRTEKAHLLGYDSYADYVTADQMAATPAAVYALLDEIWTPALDRAK